MAVVTLDEIEALSNAALVKHGASEWIAAEVSRAVRRAEQTGNVICGLYYLESYCLQLASGRVNGTVDPVVSKPKPGSVFADAKFGFSQAAFSKAFPLAIETAKENGTASLAVAHAHTCTSLGFFTEQFAQSGLIAIGFTNASPVVAPPGGNKAVIGTNPIAMTVPGADKPQLHFDFSTSAVALGKITMAKAAGEAIPKGWAVDVDGNPTTDPEAALAGSLVSIGGYKGWGFGLMAEVLAAAVTGSVNSLDVGGLKLPDGAPHGLGQFYLLIDPNVHGDNFAARMGRVVEAVSEQSGARVPGASRVEADTVQVADSLWEKLSALA
jgi:(2R)-3-sulfolactate dehydrogenase (NADP+)